VCNPIPPPVLSGSGSKGASQAITCRPSGMSLFDAGILRQQYGGVQRIKALKPVEVMKNKWL